MLVYWRVLYIYNYIYIYIHTHCTVPYSWDEQWWTFINSSHRVGSGLWPFDPVENECWRGFHLKGQSSPRCCLVGFWGRVLCDLSTGYESLWSHGSLSWAQQMVSWYFSILRITCLVWHIWYSLYHIDLYIYI